MLNYSQANTQRSPFLTSVVPVAAGLPIHELPYTSALLLPLPALSSAIVCNQEFVESCEVGYGAYFELLDEWVGGSLTFVYKPYILSQVYTLMRDEFSSSPVPCTTSCSFRAGFVFGWLSALANYQPAHADRGLSLLVALVKKECAHV